MTSHSFFWRTLTLTLMSASLAACGGSDSDARPGPTLQERLQGYWHGVIETDNGAVFRRSLTINMGWVVAGTVNERDETPMDAELVSIGHDLISLHTATGKYAGIIVAPDADAMLLLDETLNISVLAPGAPRHPAEALPRDAINGTWQGTGLIPDGSGTPLDWPDKSTLSGLTRLDVTMQCAAEQCLLTLGDDTGMSLDLATQKQVPGLVEFNGDLRVWDGVELTDGISQRRATLILTEEADFAGGYICPDRTDLSISGCLILALTRTTSG